MSAAPWYEQRERGSAAGLCAALWLYRALGRRAAGALLYPIAAYFLCTDAAARRASRAYLQRLARAGAPQLERGGLLGRTAPFRHFLEFARQILDRVGFWLGEPDEFALEVHGMAELDRVAREGRGALVLGSHLGSFDALRLVARLRSPIPVNALMYTRHAARINALLERLARREPAGGAARVLALPPGPGGFAHALELRQRVARGEVVALLADRIHPAERERVAHVRFLGASAALPQGPWLLASALGCPVLLMTALRCGERSYAVHVERLAERIALPRRQRAEAAAHWCQRYAERLESYCLRAPYQWFNFYAFWEEDCAARP